MAVIAPPDEIIFIKFLSDCQITSVASTLEQLSHIVKKYGELFDNIKLDSSNIPHLLEHCLTQHCSHFMCWRNPHPLIKEGGAITVYLTKIPHVVVGFNPPLTGGKQCEELRNTVLEKCLVDLVEICEPDVRRGLIEKVTLWGQTHWIYLYQKIKPIPTLNQMWTQKNPQGVSVVYQFAIKCQKVFSSEHPYIQLTHPYLKRCLSDNHFKIQSDETVKQFLTAHDQKLLMSWGGKQFRANLYPLRVSMDEWMKAV